MAADIASAGTGLVWFGFRTVVGNHIVYGNNGSQGNAFVGLASRQWNLDGSGIFMLEVEQGASLYITMHNHELCSVVNDRIH